MRNLIIFAVAVLIFSGCSGAMAFDEMKASTDLMNSKNVYQTCLKEKPGNCLLEKELYYSDVEAMRVLRANVR